MDLKQLARDARSINARLIELRTEAAANAKSLGLCPFHMDIIDKILEHLTADLESFAEGADNKKPCSLHKDQMEQEIAKLLGLTQPMPTPDPPESFKSMLESIFGVGNVEIIDFREDKKDN